MKNEIRQDSPAVRKRLHELQQKRVTAQVIQDEHDENAMKWAFLVRPAAALASLHINTLELVALREAQQAAVEAVEDREDHAKVYTAWMRLQGAIISADALVMHASYALRAALERVAQRRYDSLDALA